MQSLSKTNLSAGSSKGFGLGKSDEMGTNNQLQSILFLHDCFFFCAEGGREEKADLGKSERLCGGRKRREGNNSSLQQSCTVHSDICVSKNLHEIQIRNCCAH